MARGSQDAGSRNLSSVFYLMSVFYYNLRNRRLERVADRNDDLMRKNAWQMDIKDRQVLTLQNPGGIQTLTLDLP